jgi:hypothetical protein
MPPSAPLISAAPHPRKFADSKTLTEEQRESLFEDISADDTIAHSVESISAKDISHQMLSRWGICPPCRGCWVLSYPAHMPWHQVMRSVAGIVSTLRCQFHNRPQVPLIVPPRHAPLACTALQSCSCCHQQSNCCSQHGMYRCRACRSGTCGCCSGRAALHTRGASSAGAGYHTLPERRRCHRRADLNALVYVCRTKVSLNVMAETATCQLIEGASLAGYNLTEVRLPLSFTSVTSLPETPILCRWHVVQYRHRAWRQPCAHGPCVCSGRIALP